MSDLFDIQGDNLDLDFEVLKPLEHSSEPQLRNMLQEMWDRYEPYADPDFRNGFARDVAARIWEMYLGYILLEADHTLLTANERNRKGGQPDICILDNNRRIWIEAITPDLGQEGPDQIVRPTPINRGGRLEPAPTRQAQLRVSGAFFTKAQRIGRYLEQGVIAPEDTRIIAINASRFGIYFPDRPLPLIIRTLFPIGDPYITIDRLNGDVLEERYHSEDSINREGTPIPRNAFFDERFAHISGVIWTRIGIGNLSRQVRQLIFVHNPLAQVPLETNLGVWDSEFVATQCDDGWELTDILAQDSAGAS